MRSWLQKRKREKEWARTSQRVAAASATRKELLRGQEQDVLWLEALFFEADPIGINFESNTDEYRPEAETVQLRKSEAGSVEDVRRIVYEEFIRWFGDDVVGTPEKYEQVARSIWKRWSAQADTGLTTG